MSNTGTIPTALLDTIIVETNRKSARYDELAPDTTNARWTTAIDGGLVIEKGDKISVEATAINSIGGDSDEIELKGINVEGIYDNKVAVDFNYYITNRQQFNLNLPKMDHLNNQDPNDKGFGGPQMATYRDFLRNYYFDNLEGLVFNDGKMVAARSNQTWEVLNPKQFEPQTDAVTGAYFFQGHTNSVQNAPASINQSNNTRFYVGNRDFQGPYFFQKPDGEESTPLNGDDWKRYTRNKGFDVTANFLTPSSIAKYITEELHSREGNADEFGSRFFKGTTTDEGVPAENRYPHIAAFYGLQDITFGLKDSGAISGQGFVSEAAVSDLSMIAFPTVTGRLTAGVITGEWSNHLPYNQGIRLTEFEPGTYDAFQAMKMYYQHLLVGDAVRFGSMSKWWSLFPDIGNLDPFGNVTRFSEKDIEDRGNQLTSQFKTQTAYSGLEEPVFNNAEQSGWFAYRSVLMDDLPFENFDFPLQYTNLNRPTKFAYDVNGMSTPGTYNETPELGGEYIDDMRLWKITRGDVVVTNIPYNKVTVNQLQDWLTTNQYPITFTDAGGVLQKDLMVADINVGETDDANSCGVADQYTMLPCPFNFNLAEGYAYRTLPNGQVPTSYGFFNDNDLAASGPTQTSYECDPTVIGNNANLLAGAYRYKNIRGNKGAKSTFVRAETVFKTGMITSDPFFDKEAYRLPAGSDFSFQDTMGRYFNTFINADDVVKAPILPVFLKPISVDGPGIIATISRINVSALINPYPVGSTGNLMPGLPDGTLPFPSGATFVVLTTIDNTHEGSIRISNGGNNYREDMICDLEGTNGSQGSGATLRITGMKISYPSGSSALFKKTDIANMPFCAFIMAQPSKTKLAQTKATELEQLNFLPNLIPWPFAGEIFGPSRSIYDGEYSQIASSEKTQNTLDVSDPGVQLSEDDGNHYLSAFYNWDRQVAPVVGSATWQGPGQWTNIYAYKPYVFIGADDPVCLFDAPSSRFSLSQLGTSIRAGNKSSVWYQGQDPSKEGNVPPGAATAIITPFPLDNTSSADKITSFNEYESSFSRLTGFRKTGDSRLTVYRPGAYTQDITIAQEIPGADVGTPGNEGGRQNAEITSPISTQAGIAIENIYGRRDNQFVKIVSSNQPEFTESLWQRLGFDFHQLVPKFGQQSTVFNRTNHNSPVRDLQQKTIEEITRRNGPLTDAFLNQVKPFTTNNYISGSINVAGAKVPPGRNSYLLSGIGADIASVRLSGAESDSLDALNLPKKLAYPYLLVYSDIVENSMFYGSSNDSISNRKLMGYISRNYSNGNYFFSFATGWTYTSDRNRTISYVSTSIHYPDGRLALLDDNSSVIYKIERIRNFMDNTTNFDGIIKELESQKK